MGNDTVRCWVCPLGKSSAHRSPSHHHTPWKAHVTSTTCGHRQPGHRKRVPVGTTRPFRCPSGSPRSGAGSIVVLVQQRPPVAQTLGFSRNDTSRLSGIEKYHFPGPGFTPKVPFSLDMVYKSPLFLSFSVPKPFSLCQLDGFFLEATGSGSGREGGLVSRQCP